MREVSFLYVTHCHDLFYITVKYHDYIPKGIEITQRTRICIKKRGLSILHATQSHDMFYITVKFHQNIPNGFQVIERTRNGRTDARLIGISPEPFGRGIKTEV